MLRREHIEVISKGLDKAFGSDITMDANGKISGAEDDFRLDQKKGQIRLYRGNNETIPEALVGTCSVNENAIAKMLRKANMVGIPA